MIKEYLPQATCISFDTIFSKGCCFSTVTVDCRAFISKHRRRINTEEKAKVVALVGGEELFQFLAA